MSELSRLRWKARRGTKELDTLLGAFLQAGAEQLSAHELQVFDRLLDEQDDRLMAYFFQRQQPTDGELRELVDTILTQAGPPR